MANMSYCRFANTYNDIKDCITALEERSTLSKTEKRYANQLLIEILDYFEYEEIINDYDRDKIKILISECEND